MGISDNEVFKKSDLDRQAQDVSRLIKRENGTRVLELAAGSGANTHYLAQRFQDVDFTAIDLFQKPQKRYQRNINASFLTCDFHKMDDVEDKAYDIAFVIEALCHSTRKVVVLEQVAKKLKSGGLFVIYDGLYAKQKESYSKVVQTAATLVEKGMSVDKFDSVGEFDDLIKETNVFEIEEKKNLSPKILPTVERFERKASFFYNHPRLSRVASNFLPRDFVKNSFTGYLMPVLLREGIAQYWKYILRRR